MRQREQRGEQNVVVERHKAFLSMLIEGDELGLEDLSNPWRCDWCGGDEIMVESSRVCSHLLKISAIRDAVTGVVAMKPAHSSNDELGLEDLSNPRQWFLGKGHPLIIPLGLLIPAPGSPPTASFAPTT